MRSLYRTRAAVVCLVAGLAVVLVALPFVAIALAQPAEEPEHSAALDDAIIAAAKRHGVPEHLVRRIIMRESRYNPRARNHSFWGLMQISYPTAKSMGFKGTREELLNPVVNLRYAVPYLANAFVIAGKREDAAVRLYAAGYYFTARSKGLLPFMRTADSAPLAGAPEEPVLAANAVAQPPQSVGIFGALFGPGQSAPPQPTQVAAYSADTTQQGPQLGQAPQVEQAPAAAPSASPAAPSGSPAGPASADAPAGTFNGASVAMVASKSGELGPPKKWTRDGGVTLIARGEQGLDQVADRSQSNEVAPRKTARRHPAKITLMADLSLPPTSAQAYAAPGGQDPRFAAADSQAAITQATAGPAPTAQPVAPQADAVASDVPPVEKPAKRRRTHLSKHRKSGDDGTQQALAEKSVDPAPAPSAPQ